MTILKAKFSFYGYNQNGSLNKKINMGTFWIYKGVENKRHKLERIYKNSDKKTYVYLAKTQIKENFTVIEYQ